MISPPFGLTKECPPGEGSRGRCQLRSLVASQSLPSRVCGISDRKSATGMIWALPACLCASLAACLPDPVINVPDFSPPGATDGGMVTRMDAPSGDLGSARWSADGTVAAGPTLRAAWIADPGV